MMLSKCYLKAAKAVLTRCLAIVDNLDSDQYKAPERSLKAFKLQEETKQTNLTSFSCKNVDGTRKFYVVLGQSESKKSPQIKLRNDNGHLRWVNKDNFIVTVD
ncbi:hypothetical protein [uncultured Mediterranean phage uvMED]|nr:hypothetical protein [uncultured Mediterranean phage uvMED]